MIQCHQCSHNEYFGTLYCGECGTILVQIPATGSKPSGTTNSRVQTRESVAAMPPPTKLPAGVNLALQLVSTGELVPLTGGNRYTLGRAIGDQAVIPDIDLDPMDAASHGISRIHAEIRVQADGAHVVDLESSNGTALNGIRLKPYVSAPVVDGDLLALGSLQFNIVTQDPK